MPHIFTPVGAAATLLLLTLFFLFTRWRRLRDIPGPFLAALTDIWLAYKYWNRKTYPCVITELHAQYGPVVRWGPNRVSFASPHCIPAIYGIRPIFRKAESYLPLTIAAGGKEIVTLLTTRDENRISTIKRHMTAGFSQASFLKQEPQIDDVLIRFLDMVKTLDSGVVRISELLRFWSFDTVNRVAFSDDLGYMSAGTDYGNIFAGSSARFQHWRLWWALPRVERLLFKNPIASRRPVKKNVLTQVATERIRQRQEDDDQSLERDLLGRFLKASRDEPAAITKEDVLAITISTIHAGSDTIARTTGMLFANLLKHPSKMACLEREILLADLAIPPPYEKVAELPYLDSVIRESLRITPTIGGTLEREVPPEGATICDTWVPGGTDVSVSIPHSQTSTEIYGLDSAIFRPERWIECDKDTFYSMEKHFLGFSMGRRVCTGQHLARIEMKKVVASLISLWKISPVEDPSIGFHGSVRDVDLRLRLCRR